MITANLITHANNTAIYQSGHQVAHRFGVNDKNDNVAAWPDLIESAYSVKENEIDQGSAADRYDEAGTIDVETIYQDSEVVLNAMVDACFASVSGFLTTATNWNNLKTVPINANPTTAPDASIVKPVLKK